MSFETELEELLDRYDVRVYSVFDNFDNELRVEFVYYSEKTGDYKYLTLLDKAETPLIIRG